MDSWSCPRPRRQGLSAKKMNCSWTHGGLLSCRDDRTTGALGRVLPTRRLGLMSIRREAILDFPFRPWGFGASCAGNCPAGHRHEVSSSPNGWRGTLELTPESALGPRGCLQNLNPAPRGYGRASPVVRCRNGSRTEVRDLCRVHDGMSMDWRFDSHLAGPSLSFVDTMAARELLAFGFSHP